MTEEIVQGDSARPDNSHYFAYSASLRITGEIEDFDAISNALELKPTRFHRCGDRISEGSKPYPCDMWLYMAPILEEQPLDDHIQALWSQVRPHKQYLLKLKQKMKVDVCLGYRSSCDHAGFEVSPQSLEMFIELNIPFGVSVIIA